MDTGFNKIQEWDKYYSDWLCIPRSIKTTSIKPSGTVSLLAGVTPGIHYPISQYYIRNVRFAKNSPLLVELKEKGYTIEKDAYGTDSMVVSFPIEVENFDRDVKGVSMWEQLENVAQLQEHWADNQVSVTITFNQNEAKDIKNALELYENRIKGVSFLPYSDHGYVQAPYIPITKEEYEKESAKLKRVSIVRDATHETGTEDKFCEACVVKL
jgi:ribonucleotide reductase alpha subunit